MSSQPVGRGRTMRIFPVLGWMLIPGCWALTGPGTVRGPAGGSVAVRCAYGRGYESYKKYWCRGESVLGCADIAKSSGTEAEVKRGRVSLRDNHTLRSFTVTVENLTAADAGTYRCGVDIPGRLDLTHTVQVTVTPAGPTPSATRRSPTTPKQPGSSSSPKSTSTWTTAKEGESSSSTNQDPTSPRPQDFNIILHILTPCVLLVLVSFVLAAVVLVRVAKRRKKGASVQRDKKINLSSLRVGNNTADVSPEYEVMDPAADTHQTGFYANAEILPSSVNPESSYAEIQPHGQGAAGTEEVSYVTVTISTPDEQPIYANTEQRPKAERPASPPEKALYSALKKPKH